jgi:hypothetical protein
MQENDLLIISDENAGFIKKSKQIIKLNLINFINLEIVSMIDENKKYLDETEELLLAPAS